MQWQQNLWPQLVCTGSRSPKWQRGHSYLLSKGGSKYSSYPSELGSTSFDDKPSSAELSVPLVADMGLVWETNGKIAGQSVLLSALGDDHPATYHHKSSLWSYVSREYWKVKYATNIYKELRLSKGWWLVVGDIWLTDWYVEICIFISRGNPNKRSRFFHFLVSMFFIFNEFATHVSSGLWGLDFFSFLPLFHEWKFEMYCKHEN